MLTAFAWLLPWTARALLGGTNVNVLTHHCLAVSESAIPLSPIDRR